MRADLNELEDLELLTRLSKPSFLPEERDGRGHFDVTPNLSHP